MPTVVNKYNLSNPHNDPIVQKIISFVGSTIEETLTFDEPRYDPNDPDEIDVSIPQNLLVYNDDGQWSIICRIHINKDNMMVISSHGTHENNVYVQGTQTWKYLKIGRLVDVNPKL